VHTLELFHGHCTSVGYALFQEKEKKIIRRDLTGANMEMNIKNAKKRGENIYEKEYVEEEPRLAFLLDTTGKALDPEVPTAKFALQCPTVIAECTYLGAEMKSEAKKRNHIYWPELRPLVLQSARQNAATRARAEAAKGENESKNTGPVETSAESASPVLQSGARAEAAEGEKEIKNAGSAIENKVVTWVLVHFSLRYSDDDIKNAGSAIENKMPLLLPRAGKNPRNPRQTSRNAQEIWLDPRI